MIRSVRMNPGATAPAAANQSNADRFTHSGMHAAGHGKSARNCRAYGQAVGGLQKITPRGIRRIGRHGHILVVLYSDPEWARYFISLWRCLF